MSKDLQTLPNTATDEKTDTKEQTEPL